MKYVTLSKVLFYFEYFRLQTFLIFSLFAMNLLWIFEHFIGSVISGVWNMFNSVAGLALVVPTTVAVLKTNTNKSYQITCLLIMFISIVAA